MQQRRKQNIYLCLRSSHSRKERWKVNKITICGGVISTMEKNRERRVEGEVGGSEGLSGCGF